jgi:hypothetical protein
MAAETKILEEESQIQSEREIEAKILLAQPPSLSPHPTDSFWLHTTAPFDEEALKQTKIQSDPYDYVIIGTFWLPLKDVASVLHRDPDQPILSVIGAGLTGVCIAYWLIEFGVSARSILIVDGRGLAEGATGRNGGHCWPSTRVWDEERMYRFV